MYLSRAHHQRNVYPKLSSDTIFPVFLSLTNVKKLTVFTTRQIFRFFTISLMDLDDYYATKFSCAQCSENFPALEVSRACYSFKVSRFYEFPNNTFHGRYLLLVSCFPAGFPTCCRSFNRDNQMRNMNKMPKTFCKTEYNSLPIFRSLSAVLSANHLRWSYGFSFATSRLF